MKRVHRSRKCSLTRICIAGFEPVLLIENGKQIANWKSEVRKQLIQESEKLRRLAEEQFHAATLISESRRDNSTPTSYQNAGQEPSAATCCDLENGSIFFHSRFDMDDPYDDDQFDMDSCHSD
jgi:hypothetical protein